MTLEGIASVIPVVMQSIVAAVQLSTALHWRSRGRRNDDSVESGVLLLRTSAVNV